MSAVSMPGFAENLSREAAQRQLAQILSAAGIASADLDARLLLCAALSIDHVSLVRDPHFCIGAGAGIVAEFCARRLKREPVSHILGRREFWGLAFEVGSAVLDPRADTETLIEAAIDMMRARRNEALRILDLGTGSGAILAALLSEFSNATGFGVEISSDAARLAKANLDRLGFGLRGFIIRGDWTRALRGRFDLIVANPPYIPRADIAGLAPEVRVYEPHLALGGGADGLCAYRTLVHELAGLLAPGAGVALECGLGQSHAVAAILQSAGFGDFVMRHDLAGHPRTVTARVAT